MNLKCDKGFTLIELLVSLAIIGILAAIAIPAYLGQREKAKAVALEGSVRAVAMEVHGIMDSFNSHRPIVIALYSGAQTCIEKEGSDDKNRCSSLHPNLGVGGAYDGIEDVVVYIIRHYNVGMGAISPYDSAPLFTEGPEAGHALITNSGDSALWLSAYSDNAVVLYNSPINAR